MNSNILRQYEEALVRHDVSQNRSSAGVGYSAAAISQWRRGEYTGDEGALEDAVVQWLARLERSRARKRVPVVETDQMSRIAQAIAMAHANADIALIVDDAGGGKTTAARAYAERNSRSAILIDVVKGMNSRALLLEMARRLGIEAYRVNQTVLTQTVADALAERETVVILDEADYLRADALEFSRRLVYDLGRSGLVLIGLPRLVYAIQNLKNDHRQLESRIGIYLPLSGLTKKDATKIADSVWAGVDKEVVAAIYKIAKSDTRQFVKIIERCQDVMAANGLDSVTADVVATAASCVMKRWS
jgi:DNA transposition AAA+ family ATPase